MIQFMVTLSCIPHNSTSTKILNLLRFLRLSGSVVTRRLLSQEAAIRIPQVSGRSGVFHAGTGRPRPLLAFFLWARWVGVLLRHTPIGRVGVHFVFLLGLELELIQTQMAQKPMLRAEVGMRVRCANKASAE